MTSSTYDINDPSTMDIALITEMRGVASTPAAAKTAKEAPVDVSHMLFGHI
jgi:hypothetical protein